MCVGVARPLTLTVTFYHPEQSLLHKLHWLDHVIRVGVFSVNVARAHTHRHGTESKITNQIITKSLILTLTR